MQDLENDGPTFSPVHQPREPQCTALPTDRQTDGRHDDANSRSYCAAVRSAKKFAVVAAEESIMMMIIILTRKLCYRKDDRAMRPIYRLFYHNFVHAYVHYFVRI